jgi:hypothetical protein
MTDSGKRSRKEITVKQIKNEERKMHDRQERNKGIRMEARLIGSSKLNHFLFHTV